VDPDDPVVLPVEDALDLHPFRPNETASVVEEYVAAAAAKGFREVRLVHGRGIGVQREIVRKTLARLPEVASFGDAPPERGGWGATVAVLK
jgi:dsDNA-specific endonuclease/ATPase MutS2